MGTGWRILEREMFTPATQAGLLVAIAGYADAVGFLQFRAFAGQMTGNTILLAISVVEGGWLQAVHYVGVILCFLAGVAIAGGLVRLGYPSAIALSLSATALAVCAFVTARSGAWLLALAMGTQNAAVTRFGDATINTVFITGDLQKLFEAVLSRRWPARSARATPGFGILALVWVEYLLGALLGALAHFTVTYPLLIPAALLPLVMLGRPGTRSADVA